MVRGRLTEAQIKRLLKPVPADRIEAKQGMSYLPQHEARAELIRVFGPGGADHHMHEPKMLYETRLVKGDSQYPDKGTKPEYWVTGYMAGCTVHVYDYAGELVYECTEYHFEENAPLPNRGEAHAMAVTSAQSYALRRALLSLGDAFGLHLYDKGSKAPLVKGSLILQGDKDSPMYVPPAVSQTPAAGGTVHQVSGVVGVGSGSEQVDNPMQAAMNVRPE